MTAQALADALGGRPVGGQYMACCPVHEDRTPSLAITEKSGKVLVKCFAGCAQGDVISELEKRGLWDAQSPHLTFEQRIQRTYGYTDSTGKLLYQVVRLHSPKDFRQRHPTALCRTDGDGRKVHSKCSTACRRYWRLPLCLLSRVKRMSKHFDLMAFVRPARRVAVMRLGWTPTPER